LGPGLLNRLGDKATYKKGQCTGDGGVHIKAISGAWQSIKRCRQDVQRHHRGRGGYLLRAAPSSTDIQFPRILSSEEVHTQAHVEYLVSVQSRDGMSRADSVLTPGDRAIVWGHIPLSAADELPLKSIGAGSTPCTRQGLDLPSYHSATSQISFVGRFWGHCTNPQTRSHQQCAPWAQLNRN
jgi:hypothetical protein